MFLAVVMAVEILELKIEDDSGTEYLGLPGLSEKCCYKLHKQALV